MEVYILQTKEQAVAKFVEDLVNLIKGNQEVHIALSGGNTPRLAFALLSSEYNDEIDWDKVHFYWGDERCVPPNDSESNYNMALLSFLSQIDISNDNIHRIKGENDPEKEALRYSIEILKNVPQQNSLPCFDLIWLGMGDDGHTASIFPHELKLMKTNRICEVATHPQSGQKRITLTGRVLNNARNVSFLVTGENKGEKILSVLRNGIDHELLPAGHILPTDGILNWYLDKDAASKLQ